MTTTWRSAVLVLGVALAGLGTVVVPGQPAAAAQPQPTLTPSVTRHTLGTNGAIDCPRGVLCVFVAKNGSPDSPGYYFRLIHCQTYYLNHWHSYINGDSAVLDNQTGGVTTTLYSRTGAMLQRFKPKAATFQYVNGSPPRGGWEPVWSIKVC